MPISLLCESVVAVTPPGVLSLRDETGLLVRDDLASPDSLLVLRDLSAVAVIHRNRQSVNSAGEVLPLRCRRQDLLIPVSIDSRNKRCVLRVPTGQVLKALEQVDHLSKGLVVRALNLPDDRLRKLPNRKGLIRHSVQDSSLKQVSHLVGAIPVIPREQLVIVPVLHADLVTDFGQESLTGLLLKPRHLLKVVLRGVQQPEPDLLLCVVSIDDIGPFAGCNPCSSLHVVSDLRDHLVLVHASPSYLVKQSKLVSDSVNHELPAGDPNRGCLDVLPVDVDDSESLLPVACSALEITGLAHVHQIAALHACEGLRDLASVAGAVRSKSKPVGVAHDDRSTELLRRVQSRSACVLSQSDTAEVAVRCDPARSEVVKRRQLPNLVVVELQQDVHVESVALGKGRCVLAEVDPRALVVIAFQESDVSGVDLPERLNQVTNRVLGIAEHRALELASGVLVPS